MQQLKHMMVIPIGCGRHTGAKTCDLLDGLNPALTHNLRSDWQICPVRESFVETKELKAEGKGRQDWGGGRERGREGERGNSDKMDGIVV